VARKQKLKKSIEELIEMQLRALRVTYDKEK
jgi:hypothetical protein